jgi:hypothetical protein
VSQKSADPAISTGYEVAKLGCEREPRKCLFNPPIEQLLDFLINHWSEPTINARTIHWRGPSCTRNRKSVIELAEALVAAGWLSPVIKPRRRDMRVWEIVRGPSR